VAGRRPPRAHSWKQTAPAIRLHEAMIRRALVAVAALYVTAAAVGHARERAGAIACGCSEDCWCKRPGLSAFRWAFPFRHRPRVP
jgi:hypothetical protein